MTDVTTEVEKRTALAELFDEPEYGEYGWLLPGIASADGEHIVTLCRQIQEEHAMKCIDGVVVDAWTAAAIVKVADSLNPTNRAKFIAQRSVVRMGDTAQKVWFRAQVRKSDVGG